MKSYRKELWFEILNELGYKLDGIKGQWIVDSILFDKFMDQMVCH